MNDRLSKFLIDIGLSEKESSVYLALLPVDGSSVIELAKATSINRTTLYPILEDLVQKRLIVEVKQGKKTIFQAEPPERIETFVHARKFQLEEQEKMLGDIIPQMRGVSRKVGEKSIVKIYEGREGVIEAMNDYYEFIEPGEQLYLVYPRDLIEEVFTPKDLESLKKRRVGKHIISNAIYTKKDGDYNTQLVANSIRIDHDKYPLMCDIAVYRDRIRIVSLKRNLSAILIKNKDVAETLESIIRFALDMYEKLEKKEKE